MKKLLLSIIAVVMATLCLSADNAKPCISFDETTHDFGTISEKGGQVTCYFDFVNKGDAPLVIVTATAQCGCTTPDYPRRPVEPGDSGRIQVKFNPKGRPGEFTKVVSVKSNDKKNRIVKLKITGFVVPGEK